jgi:hypothetical protein
MLENTRREFGGVGWPNVVDIALVRGGRRQLIAKSKFGAPPGRNQLIASRASSAMDFLVGSEGLSDSLQKG